MNDPVPDQPTPPPGPPTTAPIARSSRQGASLIAWIVSLSLAAIVGALLFVGGFLAAGATGAGSCAAPNDAFAPLCEAYDKLQQRYVDRLDDEKLAEGAIRGMFQYGVEDPFSGYMAPDDYRRALGDLSGTFSGIGAEMGVKNIEDPGDLESCQQFTASCVLVVVAPLEDSPAEKAGLQPGDIVKRVDGDSVEGLALDDAVKLIRGESGTDVTLEVQRDDETLEITITRAEIQLREVTSRMLDDGVGYVALHGFSDAAADQFHDAIAELLDEGATSFVLDLRNNPGGYIEAARRIASEFIGSGVLFVQESSGDEVKEWEATGEGLATDPEIRVVVLVNNGSASASEIVAAALKERDRATVVGQPTYGKNTVQLWERLENGGGVRITISRWFTPDRNSVAPDGVQPDVAVEVPDGTPPEEDPFLDRAVEVLGSTTGSGTDSDAESSPDGDSKASASPAARIPTFSPYSWDSGGLLRARV